MKLYGIRNCDTVKKARKWLDDAGIDYEFHDFKKDGLDTARLSQWEQAAGWEV
ncbi:MAG: arsenate reductase, partial [Marinobacter sp.]